MNIRSLLVTTFGLLLLGCAPEKDILEDWAGTYVGVDSRGYTDHGCRVVSDGDERALILWHYDTIGTVSEDRYPIRDFELIDRYSRNYGTRQPTWIYHYGTEGPEFFVYEYFDGTLQAKMKREGRDEIEPLEAVAEVPPILHLREEDMPEGAADLRGLQGRHFWLTGQVIRAERHEREGRLTFGAGDVFSAGFIDEMELGSRAVGGREFSPILRSPLTPLSRADQTEIPQPGSRFSGLVRLIEVREKAHSEGRAVVLSYRYHRN